MTVANPIYGVFSPEDDTIVGFFLLLLLMGILRAHLDATGCNG